MPNAADAATARAAYLAARGAGLSLSAAARAAGRDRNTVYDWRADPEFARAEESAVEDARDLLRNRIKELALDGEEEVEETTYPNGKVVVRRRRRPASRIIALAARALPEFREVPQVAIQIDAGARPLAELSVGEARHVWPTLSEAERREWLEARGLAELPSPELTRPAIGDRRPSARYAEGDV